MTEPVQSISPIRQTAIISAIAVLLSFTLTGFFYLLFYGVDGRFWQAMTMAIVVPWGISIPLGLYMSKQRFICGRPLWQGLFVGMVFDRLLSYVRPVCAARMLPLALMEIRR